MTKDNSEKERRRKKRREHEDARDARRSAARAPREALLLEGLTAGTPRGVAAIMSCDTSGRPVPTPSHYGEIRQQLDACGATHFLNLVIRHVLGVWFENSSVTPLSLSVSVSGDGDHVLGALPSELLWNNPLAERWLHLVLNEEPLHTHAVWIAWPRTYSGEVFPLIVALDRSNRVAAWTLDDDLQWHACARRDLLYSFAAAQADELIFEGSGLLEILAFVWETDPGDTAHWALAVKGFNSTARTAVTLLREAQFPALTVLAAAIRRHDEERQALDQVLLASENVSRLEQQVAEQARDLERLRQGHDAAVLALAKERGLRTAVAPTRPAVPLHERLAQIFA